MVNVDDVSDFGASVIWCNMVRWMMFMTNDLTVKINYDMTVFLGERYCNLILHDGFDDDDFDYCGSII